MSVATTILPLEPNQYRDDFPILSSVVHGDKPLVYLDNAATTQHPRQVIDAIVNTYERQYANVHRGIHWLSDQSTDLYEDARERVRAFINASAREEIIFTSGTTASINLVARSWGDANVRADDEIILTEMEHHSNLIPWQQLAARTGCMLKHIPISDDGHLRLDQLDQLLTPRTKLIAVVSISNVLGTLNPIREIIERARAADVLVLIDAAQSVPHETTDVQALDADFLAFSGHKMLGPSGIGVLYGKQGLLDAMPPFLGGGSMIRRVHLDRFEPAELPAKFEAGTPPIVPAIGLGAAIDYLQRVGLRRIREHERILARRAHEVLEATGAVRFLGPSPDEKSGIVTFTVDGVHAHDVAQIMDRSGVAVRAGHHCTMPLHKRLGIGASTRASFYLYNTLDEVDLLGHGLEETLKVFRRK
jgi:cysteine desulfurase/selenocysteine lyase